MKPAKSWICYFSPTGTSRRVAEAVGRGLNCAQTVVCDATHDAVSVAAERGDAAVFAVTVYGGHAAPLALRRLDAVRGDGTPAVVVVLYGNRAYEHAACELADFVAARGFVPVAAAAFVGEHSYSTARWPIAAGRPDGDDCAEGRSENHINAGLTVPLFLLRSSAQAAPLPAFCYLSPYLSCHFSFIFRLYNELAIIPNADKINTICMLSTGMFKILISFDNATNVEPSMDEKNPTNPTIVEQKLT